MHQATRQGWPGSVRGGTGSAAIGATGAIRPIRPGSAVPWRQRAPRTPFRLRVAGWRARNWRRAVLAWFVLSLVVMAVAAEPGTDFPKAQAHAVPAVWTVLRVAGGLTVAGVPVLLVALP